MRDDFCFFPCPVRATLSNRESEVKCSVHEDEDEAAMM